MGQTSAACKKGAGSCREAVEGVGGLSSGSELGAVDRQVEGVFGQGVGWLGSTTDRRQCLACGGRTGQVARRSGLRKEWHNMGKQDNEGRSGRKLVHCGRLMCC